MNRKVGHGGHAVLGQKLLNTQRGVGRCACKSPIMKWANALSLQKKKIHWSQTQLLTKPAGTLTGRDGFLEHSPSGENLYYKGPAVRKIILFFWGISPCTLLLRIVLQKKKIKPESGQVSSCNNKFSRHTRV